MDLKDFEKEIDPKILERGLQYYKSGKVFPDGFTMHDGESTFTVLGSEPYNVTIELRDDKVAAYSCNCPYDFGPVCKHVVAALFYMANDEYADWEEVEETPKKSRDVKKGFTKKDVEKLLNTLSHEDLKEFVRKICASDNRIKQDFVSSHINLVMPVSPDTYRLQLAELVESCCGKYGFVDWYGAGDLGRGISDMVNAAKGAIEYEEWEEAFFRLKAIIEEAEHLLNNCDDSNGYIGGGIEEALDCFVKLSSSRVPEPLRTTIFDFCLDCFCKDVLKGFSWYWTIAGCAVALSKDKIECERIWKSLDRFKKSDDTFKNWDYNRACDMRLKLLEKWGTGKDVGDYMAANTDNPTFRRTLIKRAMEAGNHAEVIRLTDDGIKNDEKELPGLANEWRDLQLQMSIKAMDTDRIIALARYFIMRAGDSYNKCKYYYDLLKKHVPETGWEAMKQGIINEAMHERYKDDSLIMLIYELEHDWQEYFNHLKTCATLRRLETAEPYLAPLYGEEFFALYAKELEDYVESNMGREAYREACRYLRRMKKLGANSVVTGLIAGFKEKNKRRRALIEELSKV